MATHVGVIAEDNSDVDVLRELLAKLTKRKLFLHKFVGHGCGKIAGKCRAWARNLDAQGCQVLIILHDLDLRNLAQLRQTLIEALTPSPIQSHVIVIPVQELEAWLLADHGAIQNALGIKQPIKQVTGMEYLQRPKEFLGDLIFRKSNKTVYYVNTVHNVRIARAASLVNLRRCPSFRPLEEFARVHL